MAQKALDDPPSSAVGKWLEKVFDSKAATNLLIVAVILFASLPIFGIGFFATRPVAPQFAVASAERVAAVASIASGAAATFLCTSGKRIEAIFSNVRVRLSLPDGRELLLPREAGANGRYANGDGSFLFWNDADGAHVMEDGHSIYSSCTMEQ